jgi:hypothetical protein
MPSRVVDFPAMWASDKLASCVEWAQAEYAWLYGLADAYGSFELTNLKVIWGRVAAIRKNLSPERLDQVFEEFHDKGLLFIWETDGKRFGHWTGSDRKGRLPPKSLRKRYSRQAPTVPKDKLHEYLAKYSIRSEKQTCNVLTESRVGQDRNGEGLEGGRRRNKTLLFVAFGSSGGF